MAQRDGYQIDGSRDAKEYYWGDSDGRARRAYSSAYADARTPTLGSDSDYMRNVARGGANFDQGRMSQAADDEDSRVYRRQTARTSTKRTPPKTAARRK